MHHQVTCSGVLQLFASYCFSINHEALRAIYATRWNLRKVQSPMNSIAHGSPNDCGARPWRAKLLWCTHRRKSPRSGNSKEWGVTRFLLLTETIHSVTFIFIFFKKKWSHLSPKVSHSWGREDGTHGVHSAMILEGKKYINPSMSPSIHSVFSLYHFFFSSLSLVKYRIWSYVI